MRLRIRQASVLDARAAAEAKAAAWREAYTGLVPDDVVASQATEGTLEATADRWARLMSDGAYLWVVVDDDVKEIVGLARACPARDADAPVPLELAMIYLRQRVQGSGVADSLLQHAIGDAEAYLWVLAGNERALAFYRRHGFEADGARRDVTVPGGSLTETRLVRRSQE